MKITASDIVTWVDSHAKEAQSQLPRWVRRLCFNPESTRQINFPAGDSTFTPGWDGLLSSEQGNAWIPAGPSRWEMGCDKDVTGKANGDYEKRTKNTALEERAACTFVFVTPRRWQKKAAWVQEQVAKREWADVKAFDADDLEQWLEQTPAVALMVGEELGFIGPGVVSPAKYWQAWSRQCSPAITTDALFTDRSTTQAKLGEILEATQKGHGPGNLLYLRADSVEEAVAFAVAVVMAQGTLSNESLVVTNPQGWRYVEVNPQLKVAIAARTEVASSPVLRDRLLVIVPYAAGDLVRGNTSKELILDRPDIYDFEKTLVAIGMEKSDARRYAASTGRSWTIFRRQRSDNPAIQNPPWLNCAESSSLLLLCLIGCWHANQEGDRQAVAGVARKDYEDIEEDLIRLACLNDAPILKIGDVWKAKSPLELMNQFGGRITRTQLDRFFALAKDMLTATDPQLELPAGERWLANVRGKVHPYSDLLFESVCDSIVKLAVRGIEIPALQNLNLGGRVDAFVRLLLEEAGAERWLSLASHLPTLAEAAPEVFLTSVEKSLRRPDTPVSRLITESGESGTMGRCWHAGLLWALEMLAWAPNRLARVALILAKLTHVPMAGNWGNTPGSSLFGLFRSWLPQTAASVQQRVHVLEHLIRHDEEVAFDILKGLTRTRYPQSAFPAHRPKWRNDDAGAGNSVSAAEMQEMVKTAKNNIFFLSKGNAARIAELLDIGRVDSADELDLLVDQANAFADAAADDESRELLREAFRTFIGWYRHYSDMPAQELENWLAPAERCYAALAPADIVTRHRWLFKNYWIELPDAKRTDDEYVATVKALRLEAINQILASTGMPGIERLILTCGEPESVGTSMTTAFNDSISWENWIASQNGDFQPSKAASCISGLLRSMDTEVLTRTLQGTIEIGKSAGWSPKKLARLLNLAPPQETIWKLAQHHGSEVEEHYWHQTQPYCHTKNECNEYVVNRLLEAKRSSAALNYCKFAFEKVQPRLLLAALNQFSTETDPSTTERIQGWHISKMIDKLENSNEIDSMDLIRLEFQLFPALVHGYQASAKALYEGIMSRPELFVELLRGIYKPEHGEREQPITEAHRAFAHQAWDVLHHCSRQPGMQADGSICGEAFDLFITEARKLCRDADRATMGDQTLGQILAHAPADEDGTWPCIHARKVLDQTDAEELRKGFHIGTMNKRGVTSRSYCEGGSQERDLAGYYRSQAEHSQISFPNVAAMLERLARTYERMGQDEDIEANLRKEGF